MIFRPYFGEFEILNLVRIGGPGLGNLLFPLSRAYIYSLKYKSEILPPIWPSLKPGAFIRGEKEKRGYTDIFKSFFLKRTILQVKNIFNKSLTENQFLENIAAYSQNKDITVKVEGLRGYFKDLEGYHNELLHYILETASPTINKTYTQFNENNIGIHIRLGDYNEENKTPIDWYVNTIKILQEDKKYQNTSFIIFSDGKDEELRAILDIPNCKRVDKPNALSDILCLSKCQIIIGSNSTFSAWAAFLGRKPFIRNDKFYLGHLYHEEENIFEGELTKKNYNQISS